MTPPKGIASHDSNTIGDARDNPIAHIKRASVRDAPMPKPDALRISVPLRSDGRDND